MEFTKDFSSVKGTTEEKLFSLVTIQQRLINDHNTEGYECNRWYQYFRPRFQAVGGQIATLRTQLSKDSTSLILNDDGVKEYSRANEKKKIEFDKSVKAIKLTNFFTGENPAKDLPDPYQDFSGYTEVDPNSNFTIGNGSSTNSKITVTNLRKDVIAYIYKDFSASHFDTFEHKFQTMLTASDTYAAGSCWCVTNIVEDLQALRDNNRVGLALIWWNLSGTRKLTLCDTEDGSGDSDESIELSEDVDYFITIDREGASCSSYIRTGSHAGSLIDTLSVTPTTANKYRYVFGVNSSNYGQAFALSYYVQDLDLQEVVSTNMKVNIADTFKSVESIQINIGDVWKDVVEIQINIGDTWKTVF